MVVYLAIASIATAIAINIGINITVSQAGTSAKNELYYNARFVTNQLQYQMNLASDVVVANSTFDSDEGILYLERSNPTTYVYFSTYDKQITSGGRQFTIKKLRIKIGDESFIDLTSDKVNVTKFRLTNLTRGTEPKTVKVELAMESLNTEDDPKYNGDVDIETSLTIKR